MKTNVITRYAPSPTGFQHIGGLRTAIFAYLTAKQAGGTFILRIEDTDRERKIDGAIEHTMEALAWLGLTYDFGPDKPGPWGSVIQSERLTVYKKYADKLIAKGLAYPDPYTPAEIEAFREQAKAEKKPFLFRDHRPNTFGAWDGSQPLRFKVPEVKRYRWVDAVRGELEGGEEMLDDVVLIKSDGFPTYNFAHIVDDYEMGVTHVMRGDEFIASTPKFLSIYDALEIDYPVFVSLPPIMNETGKKKLSKRDGAKDILDYKKEGYLPETMVNFLTLIGWNPGGEKEIFSMAELVEAFSIQRIQSSGGAFNEEKLLWMNKEHLANLSEDQYLAYTEAALPDNIKAKATYSTDRLKRLLPVMRERIHVAREITEAAEAGEYDFAFTPPDVTKELLTWKKDPDPMTTLPRLQKVITLLENVSFDSPETIKSAIWDYAEGEGRGEVLWPMRTALTGLERSPDPFIVAYVIGKEDTLHRLKAACDKIVE